MAWREALQEYLAEQAKPVEKYGHQPRLYELTKLIGHGLEYDDDVVFAAAWLHDLGVFSGHRPGDPALLARWDHVSYTLQKTPDVLHSVGFPPDRVVAVLECIEHHQPHDVPETIEATILRDADILEQLGAVGILRTVCKVGRDTRFQTFTQAVASLKKAHDTLPGKIRLDSTRALAEERIGIQRAFLVSVAAEAGELLL